MLSTECSSVSYGFSIRYLVVFLCKFSVWHKHVTDMFVLLLLSPPRRMFWLRWFAVCLSFCLSVYNIFT